MIKKITYLRHIYYHNNIFLIYYIYFIVTYFLFSNKYKYIRKIIIHIF